MKSKDSNILKRISYRILRYFTELTPTRLSNTKLKPLLFQKAHQFQKQFETGAPDIFLILGARRLYFKSLKRKILSSEENKELRKALLFEYPNCATQKNTSEKIKNYYGDRIIKGRRSVRSWKKGEITNEQFRQLVDSARWAPSSCNRQPCYFILSQNKENIRLLAEARGEKFVKDAQNCILTLINKQAYDKKELLHTSRLDAGAAIQNLLLKAQELGLGACWVNFGPKEIESTKRKKINKIFKIPLDYEVVSIIPVGLLKNIPLPPPKTKISDMLSLEKFKKR